MIIPVYQKIGDSSHLTAKKIGEKIFAQTRDLEDLKATHTGTLDPMAEGVLVVLTGVDRFNKEKYAQSPKTYLFEILWGVNTDSHDLLGISDHISKQKVEFEVLASNLENELINSKNISHQKIPDFSAKRIDGKSFFDIAKEKIPLPNYQQKIRIYDLKLVASSTITIIDLERKIEEKIALIKGDFRQKEILQSWDKAFQELKNSNLKELPLTKIEITTSKRFYIRALVRDLSEALKIPGTTFSIQRTINGQYTIEDCKKYAVKYQL